ncbi:MAG: type IV pilus modification PilV family protein [Planctomycetota bacterium]|jgi:prepilin-type N-terminal cleavage/methylation domain-containing protein
MNRNARRHVGTKARKGFSLIEVLLAVFILGIGIISIAALFPAGIAQQQQSYDDIMGPLVAQNAMSILRSKLQPEDFGSFQDPIFNDNGNGLLDSPRPTLAGDWPWLRPSLVFEDLPATFVDEAGAIDIFSNIFEYNSSLDSATEFPDGYEDLDGDGPTPQPLFGIPYVLPPLSNEQPLILVTRNERYYPMPGSDELFADDTPVPTYRPQFYWDCMFRRFQGRIQVAVFVYRIAGPGGTTSRVSLPDGRAVPYATPPNPANSERPLLPLRLPLTSSGNLLDDDYINVLDSPDDGWDANGPDNDGTNPSIVLGTANGNNYDPFDLTQSWQEPRQRIVDQNGNLHRVLSRYHDDNEFGGAMQVELVRSVPAIRPILPPYFVLQPSNAGFDGIENIVTDIWYLPRYLKLDTNGDGQITGLDQDFTLTPVFVSISEL